MIASLRRCNRTQSRKSSAGTKISPIRYALVIALLASACIMCVWRSSAHRGLTYATRGSADSVWLAWPLQLK